MFCLVFTESGDKNPGLLRPQNKKRWWNGILFLCTFDILQRLDSPKHTIAARNRIPQVNCYPDGNDGSLQDRIDSG